MILKFDKKCGGNVAVTIQWYIPSKFDVHKSYFYGYLQRKVPTIAAEKF